MAADEEQPSRPCALRLDDLEKVVGSLQGQLALIIAGQEEHTRVLAGVVDEHSQQLLEEARNLQEKLSEQNSAILKVSQTVMNLQSAVQKWAAAGTLCGAVLLYIIAKAAGL